MAVALAKEGRNGSCQQANVLLPQWLTECCPGTWARLGTVWVGECTISPESARILLRDHNNSNRSLSDSHARFLAGLIRRDLFMLNGDTLVFGSNEECQNGQHRLEGVSRSKAQKFLVVYGVDPQAFRTFDQMRTRTLSQIMEISGEAHATVLATAVQNVIGFFHTAEPYSWNLRSVGYSRSDFLAAADVIPGIRESAAYAEQHRGSCAKFRGPGTVATLHWVLTQGNRKVATDLLDSLLCEGREIGGFVRKLNAYLEGSVNRSRPLARGIREAVVIKAFNIIADGLDEPKTFVFRPRGPAGAIKGAEAYPQVSGWQYIDADESGRLLPTLGNLSAQTMLGLAQKGAQE